MSRFQIGEVAILTVIPEALKEDLAACKIYEGAVCKVLDIINDGETLIVGNMQWDCTQDVRVVLVTRGKTPEKHPAYKSRTICVNPLFLGKIYGQ